MDPEGLPQETLERVCRHLRTYEYDGGTRRI